MLFRIVCPASASSVETMGLKPLVAEISLRITQGKYVKQPLPSFTRRANNSNIFQTVLDTDALWWHLLQHGIWKDYINHPISARGSCCLATQAAVTGHMNGRVSSPGQGHKSKSTWLLHWFCLFTCIPADKQTHRSEYTLTCRRYCWIQNQFYPKKTSPLKLKKTGHMHNCFE